MATYGSDVRLGWIGRCSLAGSELCFTENRLWRAPGQQGGVNRRVRPFVLWRVSLVDGGERGERSCPIREEPDILF